MNQIKGSKAVFLRMGNDSVETARKILQHTADILQQTNEMANFGDAVAYSTRPWALLLCHSMETIKAAILTCTKEHDGHPAIDRKVLESIRVCRVRNLHELRTILSSIHLPLNSDSTHDLISWMAREKHGQPPVLLGVVDLLELLVTSEEWFDKTIPQVIKYLFVRYDQLADILALLTETCIYLNNNGIETWEGYFGHVTNRYTSLLVTDHGCLQHITDVENRIKDDRRVSKYYKDNTVVMETLYRIIEYYLGVVV